MEPTSEPENDRQSRGLARFWPGHGPTPAPRRSDEDPATTEGDAAAAHPSDQPAGPAGPNGEHPQVSDQQSQPHDDQPEPGEQPVHPFAPRPHPALTSDTQMVALGSRRPADALLGANGTRWNNQGGFPPVETNGHRNGETAPRHGGAPVTGGGVPHPDDDPLRSAFLPSSDHASRPGYGPTGEDTAPGPRSPFAPEPPRSPFAQMDDAPPGPRAPFNAAEEAPRPGPADGGARSPFAPAEENGPAGDPFAPSPFAPQAATGSAVVSSPEPPAAPPVAPPPPVARPAGAGPSAAGSAQVPVPTGGRPVSGVPVSAAPAVPPAPHPDLSAPTRLEPTGWATPGPRPAAGSATVPVSGSGTAPAAAPAPAPRPEQAAEREALRPGDVTDHAITFWSEGATEHYRGDWHEVKAQFVDDPVAALTRAHDLLTEAVNELTESMLAERDELDPLRGAAKPDTESMRMAMRGYREFLDRILAL